MVVVQIIRMARSGTLSWKLVLVSIGITLICVVWGVAAGMKSFIPPLVGSVTLLIMISWSCFCRL